MAFIEQAIIHFFLLFTDLESFNSFMRDTRSIAIVIGILVSMSGSWLGVFLLLRKSALTSDAISHTVLLGIVGAFFFMIAIGLDPQLSSPFLLIGATIAGVMTVVLTELVQRSQLVKSDAALGLVFPLLFAIAVIMISRFAEDVHLDTDAVLVGEIGVAALNTNSYCFDNCDDVVITPDSDLAEVGRQCTNCSRDGISPRDDEAIFEEVCSNCGTYTAAEAWRERLIDAPPTLAFIPESLTVMGLVTLINFLFVTIFYKELKLSSFDEALAKALGFRPVVLTYTLMTLVSLTAVGAFDAVGSILVVAFFVIPAATAYLLTDRLSIMLLISPIFGILGVVTGYELSRGSFLGLSVDSFLVWLDGIVGLRGFTVWNVSPSASMVIMTFVFFLIAWVISPKYGLISTIMRRYRNRQTFANQLLMGHLHNHMFTDRFETECAVDTLHEHMNWTITKTQATLTRTRLRGWVKVENGFAELTKSGLKNVEKFRRENLNLGWQNDEIAFTAIGD